MKFLMSGLGNFYRNWQLNEKAVSLADELGFYGAVMPDHYMWDREEMADKDSTVDAWVAITHLAAKTHRLKLGTIVTPIPFRPPGILAKMVATIDVISSGRTILGVGAGWSRAEFEGYSAWADGKTRVDMTEEGLQLILRLWQDQKVDFYGKFYNAKAAVLDPKPLQKPHPPLLFGGRSPRMLRLAGKYGDICYIPPHPWTNIPLNEAKSIVDEAARKAGRHRKLAYAAGSPVSQGSFDMDVLHKDIEKAAENGCEIYITSFPQDKYIATMEQFARDLLPSYTAND
jgi:alkanesulfonate monooxygenase SsuD/methylene tetrahydromethanopterin reductase-like flavin-dependent oxidoreductase (luciferase family)